MMKDNCTFTFIIPVYNVEQYLEECVNSILAQTFENFEIILVDDGSTDGSSLLCDRLSIQDPRIRVIHKPNGGASSARNEGMRQAKGTYIIFLDADDFWCSHDALQQVYERSIATDADVLVIKFGYYYQHSDRWDMVCSSLTEEMLSGDSYDERLLKLVKEQLYDACAWNKVFKRSLFEQNDLWFREGIIAEDIDWAARLSFAANSIAVIDDPIYGYRKEREGAVTSSLKLRNLIITKDAIEWCLSDDRLDAKTDVFKRAYYGYVAYRYVIWLAESAVVKDKNKKMLIKAMRAYRWLLKYDVNPKVAFAGNVYRLIGYTGIRVMLGVKLKLRK